MAHPTAPHSFQTTHWSIVRKAIGSDDAAARGALSTLCEAYWYPIYAFVRRSGYGPHDAEDLTQGFFAWLLEKETLAKADPEKGKLRSFLLTCARHFVNDERDRAMAQKRGGGVITSLDVAWAEQTYAAEPVDHLTPDRVFQRRWAMTVLDHSLQVLGEEFAAQGKGALFEHLRPFLGFSSQPAGGYEAVANVTKLPIGTLKNHVFRLRQRWREILFAQVAATLDEPTPEAIKAELSELLDLM
jgi:RNA polymerase sigma-70 factor (ECF subfamily)